MEGWAGGRNSCRQCVQGQFLPLTHQPADGLLVDSLTWGLWEADVGESHPQRNKAGIEQIALGEGGGSEINTRRQTQRESRTKRGRAREGQEKASGNKAGHG